MTTRRVERIQDLLITSGENVLIIDNGCDQSIINVNSFLVETYTGIFYSVGGALCTMHSSKLELVNDAYTLTTLPDNSKCILKINQAFLDTDPSQSEALLQPHQARAFGTIVDDCAHRHRGRDGSSGGQCLIVDDKKLDLSFDGWKCYFRIRKPSNDDLTKYPIYELTSSRLYEPQHRYDTRRVSTKPSVTVEEWRACLGFPTLATTKSTLQNTTQMVSTLQSETRDYMRDHYKTRVWA